MHWRHEAHARKAGRWLGDHILGTIVGLIVAAIVTLLLATVFGSGHTGPPSLARQWEQVRTQFRKQGLIVTADTPVEMRGNTQPVTFVALRHDGGCSGVAPRPSDEIRIYEVEGGQLQQAFRFQPAATGCRAWAFHLADKGDLTGSGRITLFGQFVGSPRGEPGEAVPVVVAWHERARRYAVAPLITEAPGAWLTATHAEAPPENFQRHSLQTFLNPVRLTSSKGEHAYGVSDLRFVLRGPGDSYISALYRLSSGVPVGTRVPGSETPAAPILYQRALWHLEPFGEAIAAGWCHLSLRHMTAWASYDSESKVLSQLARHSGSWYSSCEAPLTSRWWQAHHPGA